MVYLNLNGLKFKAVIKCQLSLLSKKTQKKRFAFSNSLGARCFQFSSLPILSFLTLSLPFHQEVVVEDPIFLVEQGNDDRHVGQCTGEIKEQGETPWRKVPSP